jgi:Protein of unknown function (DUF1579)
MRYVFRTTWVLAGALVLASGLSAQEKARKPAAKPAPMDEQAMMEAWKKAATPGEMHKKLDDMVGTFDASVRMWMDPTKPPEDSTAVSVNKWVLGNRYVETNHEGTMMGEPFNGIGYTGYDNVQKKYVGTWMDSAGTGIMNSTCALAADGKSMTCKASFWDAMTGKPNAMEMKTSWTDHDHHAMEMWGAGPDGKKYKMMEITYTRKS